MGLEGQRFPSRFQLSPAPSLPLLSLNIVSLPLQVGCETWSLLIPPILSVNVLKKTRYIFSNAHKPLIENQHTLVLYSIYSIPLESKSS